jgi:hypothetical protein
MGVRKNAKKPIAALVVAAYKEQIVGLKKWFLHLAQKLQLGDEQCARIQFNTIDNMQGDAVEFVIYDMITTTAPAFVAERSWLTLGFSCATVFQVAVANCGNFIGYERNAIIGPRALELSRAWKYLNNLKVTVSHLANDARHTSTPLSSVTSLTLM